MKKLLTTLALVAIFAVPGFALDISGSFVDVAPFEAENGTTELCFYVYNGSEDFEWVADITITLPACMTILDPPPASATPEDGTSFNVAPAFDGYGTNVAHWYGTDAYGFGFLYGLSGGYFCVTVEIDCACDNVFPIHWDIAGDGYSGEPHLVNGESPFTVLCSTSTDRSSWSNVKSLY